MYCYDMYGISHRPKHYKQTIFNNSHNFEHPTKTMRSKFPLARNVVSHRITQSTKIGQEGR
jgi:hypothetical protein